MLACWHNDFNERCRFASTSSTSRIFRLVPVQTGGTSVWPEGKETTSLLRMNFPLFLKISLVGQFPIIICQMYVGLHRCHDTRMA